jgi:hypothetical protein
MNLHVTRDSFWLRIGRFGVSAFDGREPAIDAWTVASFSIGATRVRLLHLP